MLIIAHRSNGGEHLENTLSAIKDLKSLNIDMIEIDVRVTKDNIPILHHDKYITASNKKLYIDSENYNNLKKHNKELTTLQDALNIEAKYLIDIKPNINIKPIIDLLKKSSLSKNILITSFDFRLLKKLKKDLPNINLAILDRWSGVRASSRARRLQTNIIIMNQKWLWSGFIKSMNNSGYSLYVYTLNDNNRALRWKKSGLAGVITDKPKILKD